MMKPSIGMMVVLAVGLTGCHCPSKNDLDMDLEESSSGEFSTGSSESSDTSTGEPFDASRWIGRYHFENYYLPFGERGDPLGTYALINLEILRDGRATVFYDDCSFDEATTRAYQWFPSEDGWLSLEPGTGEPLLRFLGPNEVGALRIQRIDPCLELRFEVDGVIDTALRFYPGESCWVDRCTEPHIMQVDYCDGEEPPACP